ncbi:MAG: DNA-formamidopyrimidine glycosylase [Candidatus Lambdaproteobacteria bacterium RIFOXYD12_FULL_49_8]|uniref:Formamidopyrimidine-DNA glycosylase n=1 Tax=Candidatus Lambdaproteobacteria bacterium RIFOXYD2_FULL_50_16 TaxID=1817772 RepID=A0A1F6GBH6_9PROT|nr:MAG: DNA-formamidopyrimidine glycosylase [Candidatus Lambdaproteobacteria bacterium RIFOXYD2_FULL_50_16]OGG97733.1 MAG: DNA-formamidopyrimidine glycosylase [Candidatus Lambdaproteobacteria bacterium RIFOXYD12_FULL_49_8]
MPELPEVETLRRELSQALVGFCIKKVTVNRASVVKGAPDSLKALNGRAFGPVLRRAKYLLFTFGEGPTLLAHLGMSGKFIVDQNQTHQGPHDRVVFDLDQGRRLIFCEMRCFGFLELAEKVERHPRLSKLGKDPLETLNPNWLKAQWQGRKKPVKSLLLDQNILAGIGNIYASEILFAAQIHPQTPGGDLGLKQLSRLLKETKRILELALVHNGTSISDYRRVDDKTGEFQDFLQVYGQAEAPCPVCGAPIQRLVQSGRSSFFCGHCQK